MQKSSFIGLLIALGMFSFALIVYFQLVKKDNGIAIDNPSNENLEITIDAKNYTIAPGQTLMISLKQGKHHLKTKDTAYSFSVSDVNGLINPLGNTYFIFERPYGHEKKSDSIIQSKFTNYQNETYYSTQIDSSLYIEGFYYHLDQSFPEVIQKVEDSTITINTRTKIFRSSEFKPFYYQNYE